MVKDIGLVNQYSVCTFWNRLFIHEQTPRLSGECEASKKPDFSLLGV